MKHLVLVVLFVALAACSKKKADDTQGAASGSAPVAGSAGSGSAAGEGPGSAAGSGSAAAGSGEGSGAGSAAGSGEGSGSAAGSAAGSAGDAAGGGSAANDEESKFDKLSGEEKADFMKKHVVPPMKKAFQKVDAKKFANFGCKTCHGKDPKKAKYKMPNPELPKLDFAKLEAGEDKEVAEFMAKVVKPGMAKILEEKELDPQHPELGGFGCLDCHEQKK